jgi:hypothetical protein
MKSKKPVYNIFNLWRRDESERFTRRLAWYCASNSGRFADELCNLVADNSVQEICAYSIDYRVDDDPTALAYARQCLALYAKDADLVIAGVNKKANAELSFAETERRCKRTNQRFSLLYQTEQLLFCEDGLVVAVSQKISDILGDCPRLEDLDLRFGPGMNVGCSSAKYTSGRHKLNVPMTHYHEFSSELTEEFAKELPHMFKLNKLSVAVAKLSWVDKNWQTNRSIIIESILAGLGQLGVGKELKERFLTTCQINLKSQVENRSYAAIGSINDSIATIDLKNASNTIACLVVFHLIQSEDWFNLLDQLRTRRVEYNGKTIELEMFSSMGNGFTFELESIIFYAIAYVTCVRAGLKTDNISVFGDDLIVPSDADFLNELFHNLEFFGFEVNSEKSFTKGPFRESCGADFFLGTNIRPFYKKSRWTDARLIGLLNFDRANWNLFEPFRYELEQLLFNKSSNVISFGPPGFGDGHIHYDVTDPQCKMHLRRNVQHTKPINTRWATSKLDWNGSCKKHRKLSTGSVRPPFNFKTITKVPFVENGELELGDQLYPLYSIYRKAKPNKPSYTIVYDGEGSDKTRVFVNVESDADDRDNDPYVLRGGWKTKVTTVDLYPS